MPIKIMSYSVLLVFLAGCAKPKLESLVKDDSFTYDRLEYGHILISLPVVDPSTESKELKNLNDADKRKITAFSIERIRSEREHLKAKPIYAHKKYNPATLELIDSIALSATPSKADIEKISKIFMAFPDPYRYILVPKLVSERTWKDSRTYQTSQTKVVNEKEVVTYYDNQDYYAYREIDLNAVVIDLKFKKIVWDGLATKSESASNQNSNKVSSTATININFGNSNNNARNREPDYPDYPRLFSVAKTAMIAIIANLPEPS